MPTSLEYTDAPLTQARRRLHLREPLRSLAYVEMEDNGAILLNIGEWGLALHAAQILAADRPVRLRFKLPQSSIWVKATGRIVWRSESGKQAGVCFDDLSEDVREQIRMWISAQAIAGEMDARDSQATADGAGASPRPVSERITTPELRAAAHQAATQAGERSSLAGLIARTKKRLLGERLHARNLPGAIRTTAVSRSIW